MFKACAYSNNVTIWAGCLPDQELADFLGFRITRVNVATGERIVQRSHLGFEGDKNDNWEGQPSDVWPWQKPTFMDFDAVEGETYQYEFCPMVGKPGALTAREDLKALTNKVGLKSQFGNISLKFNRGILSTQWLARQLPKGADGAPDYTVLLEAIKTAGNAIRNRLAGGLIDQLTALIKRARTEGGRVHLALYELSDPELIACIVDGKDVVSLILSNTGPDDETNKPTREQLQAAGVDFQSRMLPGRHIGHNKSGVYVDASGTPRAILSGSTNWTPTGLCGQANNAIIVECVELAQIYFAYWQLLKASGNEQGADLRKANATRKPECQLGDGTVQVWFSPNTTEENKPQHGAATPPDMAELFHDMENAAEAFFFLTFFPGFPSMVSEAAYLEQKRPELIVRGAVSSPQALPRQQQGAGQAATAEGTTTDGVALFHRNGQSPDIIAAEAIEQQMGPWVQELLKAGPDSHAIIHSKVIAIDPMDPAKCSFRTGSHQLGFKASYENDENLLTVRGNQEACLAMLVHILDVYEHYRFRWLLYIHESTFTGYLSSTPDWQAKYLPGGAARRELEYLTKPAAGQAA